MSSATATVQPLTDEQRNVLFDLLDAIRPLAILLWPMKLDSWGEMWHPLINVGEGTLTEHGERYVMDELRAAAVHADEVAEGCVGSLEVGGEHYGYDAAMILSPIADHLDALSARIGGGWVTGKQTYGALDAIATQVRDLYMRLERLMRPAEAGEEE